MRRVALLVDSVLNSSSGKTSLYCLFQSGYRRLQKGECLYNSKLEQYYVEDFFPVRGSISAGEPKAFITIDRPFPESSLGIVLYTSKTGAKRQSVK